MQSSQPTTLTDGADTDELARFRKAWREEVYRKKEGPAVAPPKPDSEPPSDVLPNSTSTVDHTHPPSRSSPAITHGEAGVTPKPGSSHLPPLSAKLARAVEVYRRAVHCEQQSNLDEALVLYRTAFRMEPNVDKAYGQVELIAAAHSISSSHAYTGPPHKRHQKTASSSGGGVHEITRGVGEVDLRPAPVPVVHTGACTVVSGTLASVVASWPRNLAFEPEDEREALPFRSLPDELLVHILQYLDTAALERFAAVNRKARVLSLDVAIWREFVHAVYKPPQIAEDEDLATLLEKYTPDYRRLYVEQPRVRLDGVYIAVCHYIRAGLSENAWVNVSHLITYHRYLRFYPNGEVLSLLANDQVPPRQVISTLKPTLRMKGFFIGNWYLDGTTVRVTNLLDPSGGFVRYAFQMKLELRSRPLGRWNRLDFRAYDSVDIASGEATPLALNHERSFWFSKVRSYASA
ncbi:hypothetical protein BKA93DRAFT_803577 [Sparassis latifolia]|uniref:F-box protein n=1 Tax=Sparassis crispa TaxID=139825 RepID=A0A401GW40_9APHY|nr:F-box protein [Sparassis crispa]GBE86403.1 F-box protein [Sparassis crispa]